MFQIFGFLQNFMERRFQAVSRRDTSSQPPSWIQKRCPAAAARQPTRYPAPPLSSTHSQHCPAISVKQGYTLLPALQVCSSMTRGGTPARQPASIMDSEQGHFWIQVNLLFSFVSL